MNNVYEFGSFSKLSPNGILRGFFFSLLRTYWGYKISWVCFCCNLFNFGL